MSRLSHYRRRALQRGSAVVEVAIFSPLLALLAVGAVDYGRVLYEDIVLERAALAGAHWGAQSTSASEDLDGIEAAVLRDLGVEFSESGVSTKAERYCACSDDVEVDCGSGSCSGGELSSVYVHVEVSKTFSTLVDYPGLPGQVTLLRDAHVRAR